MNARIVLSSLVLAAFAGTAFAETPTIVTEPFVSTKSVAEVRAELDAYKAAGVNPWATSYQPLKYFKSTASRDVVVADYLASRNEVKALNGEDSGSAYLAQLRGFGMPASTLAGTPANGQ